MRHLLKQPHVIFSLENPAHPVSVHLATESGRKMAIDALNDAKGGKAFPVSGKWSHDGKNFSHENSIMISNPTDSQKRIATELARRTGQTSILFSDGKNHKNIIVNGENIGKHNKGSGTKLDSEINPTADYQTTMPDGTIFSHIVDFDNLHNN